MTPAWARRTAAVLLVALSFLTRLPALVSAAGTNSDAAVVGLQARHILHGEWSPFLWGSGYQTSADSTWAALVFLLFGKTPTALMLSALLLHAALTLLVFWTLARHMSSPWRAFVATLPLVMTTACVHSYALYPPRQLALTLAFAAIFALDLGWHAVGGLVLMLAWVADPYAALLVPGALLLAMLVVLRSKSGLAARARAMGGFYLGAGLGAGVLARLLAHPRAQQGVTTMSLSVLRHNAGLLWHECLPWVVGTKVYKPLHVMDYVAWQMPRAYSVFAWVGVASLSVALLLGLGLAFRAARPLGHLAALAWVTIAVDFAGFLVSLMVMDHFSMRYLAASVLVLPFAVAPMVERLGKGGALVLGPYLCSALAGGWLSHGPIRTDAGVVEARVLHALEERKVEAAMADYWASYRLAFLWKEAVPVVPYHPEQDRYPPYRTTFDHAKRYAYIHDRDRSFEDEREAMTQMPGRVVDRFAWEGFDVVVMER